MGPLSFLAFLLCPLVCQSARNKQPSNFEKREHHGISETHSTDPNESLGRWELYKRTESAPDLKNVVEKKTISLGLYYRPSYKMALGDVNSFHQAILIDSAKGEAKLAEIYDAVNSIVSGQTLVDGKPPWRFQYADQVSPGKARLVVARVVLGEAVVSSADIYKMLEPLPMPCSGENCVDWVKSGLKALQAAGHLQPLDIDQVVLQAVDHGVTRSRYTLKPEFNLASWEKYRDTISRYQPGKGIISDPEAVKIENLVLSAEAQKAAAGTSTAGKQRSDVALKESYRKKLSLNHFKSLVQRHGLKVLHQRTELSADQLHERFMSKLPSQRSSLSISPKAIGLGTFTATAFIIYGSSVYDVFQRDTTKLEKTAVVSSLIPVVGCVTQVAAEGESDSLDILGIADFHVCLAADALTLGGLWKIGIPVQVLRILINWIVGIVEFHKEINKDIIHDRRMQGWKRVLEQFEKVLRSDSYKANVDLYLDASRAAVLLSASNAFAELEAGMEEVRESQPLTPTEVEAVVKAQRDSSSMVQQETCEKLRRSKEELRWALKKELGRALHNQSLEFDENFVNNIKTKWQFYGFPMAFSQVSSLYRKEFDDHLLLALPEVRNLNGIIDEHLGKQWALEPNCSHGDPLPPRPPQRNEACRDACPSSARGSPALEEMTGVAKGVFECVFRNEQRQSTYEFSPSCCPLANMKLMVTADGGIKRPRCVVENA
ncbi:Heat Labile Enterotoxin Type Iib [Ophiocordyceps camponoti-floridani]|uniref:Heat Labile Enterotoxin Type Iib n=1 Tax=Ophiocordyceps camponoti-floridani TaxID=2030778 RepID=A0A8H4VBY5_9HYPO|nr:Heat Labile Enterotoxin Type Iib [Ophiocordyceps camponoti-floridani]